MSIAQAIKAAAELMPAAIEAVGALVEAGKSWGEATAIVRKDILSRADEYRRAKAADEAALLEKHGRAGAPPPNPFEPEEG